VNGHEISSKTFCPQYKSKPERERNDNYETKQTQLAMQLIHSWSSWQRQPLRLSGGSRNSFTSRGTQIGGLYLGGFWRWRWYVLHHVAHELGFSRLMRHTTLKEIGNTKRVPKNGDVRDRLNFADRFHRRSRSNDLDTQRARLNTEVGTAYLRAGCEQIYALGIQQKIR
jgi:hypothetical protein